MTRPGNVYLRLIVPLGIAFLVAMFATWVIAVQLLTNTIDRRLDDQLDHATSILAGGEFPFSPDLIARLERLIEARIALLDERGRVALSTSGGAANDVLQSLSDDINQGSDDRVRLLTIESAGSTWRIALRPLAPQRDRRFRYVAAAASLDESRQAARDAAKLLGAAMLLVTILLVWFGHRFTDLARQSRLAGLGDLAARLAHEIRNPLTAIKMQLQLLRESTSSTDAVRVDALLDEIQRMDMIVESALTLGAPIQLHRHSIRVDRLVEGLGELLMPALSHRNIDLRVAASFSAEIDADPDRLRQALLNLVNNAADELASGGDILMSVAASKNGDTVEISVEDSGSGLEGVPRNGESDKPYGLGIGLSICREIVALHDGELIVGSSAELGGAKFMIRLPLPIIKYHGRTS